MSLWRMLLLLGVATTAQAHDFYDRTCCAGVDCHPTPCENIRAVPQGFDYTDPSDHAIYFFTRDKMKPSQDEQCHVCLHKTNIDSPLAAPLCLYLPVKAELTIMDPLSMIIVAMHLMVLHSPDNQDVIINPEHVVSIRPRREEETHFVAKVQCLIHTDDGRWIGVVENCETVRDVFNKAQVAE